MYRVTASPNVSQQTMWSRTARLHRITAVIDYWSAAERSLDPSAVIWCGEGFSPRSRRIWTGSWREQPSKNSTPGEPVGSTLWDLVTLFVIENNNTTPRMSEFKHETSEVVTDVSFLTITLLGLISRLKHHWCEDWQKCDLWRFIFCLELGQTSEENKKLKFLHFHIRSDGFLFF